MKLIYYVSIACMFANFQSYATENSDLSLLENPLLSALETYVTTHPEATVTESNLNNLISEALVYHIQSKFSSSADSEIITYIQDLKASISQISISDITSNILDKFSNITPETLLNSITQTIGDTELNTFLEKIHKTTETIQDIKEDAEEIIENAKEIHAKLKSCCLLL